MFAFDLFLQMKTNIIIQKKYTYIHHCMYVSDDIIINDEVLHDKRCIYVQTQ